MDIKNVGDGWWGGVIMVVKFFEEFVDGILWVYIDIVGFFYFDKL